jgi:hypothetical protein
MNNAFATGKVVLDDISSGQLSSEGKAGAESVLSILQQKGKCICLIFTVALSIIFFQLVYCLFFFFFSFFFFFVRKHVLFFGHT